MLEQAVYRTRNIQVLGKHILMVQTRYSYFYTMTKEESVSLLLLSRFSRVQLGATPETAAHEVPPSLGFSRQEHWSGLPFLSSMHESEK